MMSLKTAKSDIYVLALIFFILVSGNGYDHVGVLFWVLVACYAVYFLLLVVKWNLQRKV
jgi:hypothetical protein